MHREEMGVRREKNVSEQFIENNKLKRAVHQRIKSLRPHLKKKTLKYK